MSRRERFDAVALTVLAVVPIALGSARAAAEPPPGAPPEDHHERPAQYAAPGWSLPPASALAPEYPLAAQFIEADPTNYSPGGMGTVQYVVVHTMQGSYEGSINWFLNPDADVSAHFCMRSADGEITQMVQLADKAWHVGTENAVAVGIEHEGFVDDASWYTWEMYRESAKLARWLADHFGLPLDRDHIVGHVELPNQTHTDPGPNWDWPLYMALVKDVVAADTIEGAIVDGSTPCPWVATQDTWIKTTLQSADALGDDARCFVAAGTEVPYLHASGDLAGHVRVVLTDDGPCAGTAVAEQGYAFAEHFSGACDPATMVPSGASVQLDGGAATATDERGGFALGGVAAGTHALSAGAPGYDAAALEVELAGYPGARVVIVLQPIPADDGGGDSGGGSEGGGSTSDAPEDPAGTSGGEASSGTAAPDGPGALPDTFGEGPEAPAGCACTAAQGGGADPASGFAALTVVGLAALRRRRRATHRPA
ncbi:MAG: N-acetylmuramoyl-L-alanine amidase [Nannocystaceae bacterium]|nr:N-acetylmuramoyl-L-alanine amidase [Nannocystaceae bacterium]